MNKQKYYHMDVAEVLDKIFDVYKKGALTQILFGLVFSIIMYIVIFVVLGVLGLIGFIGFGSMFKDFFSGGFSITALSLMIGFITVAMFACLYGFSLRVNGSLYIASQTMEGRKTDISKAISMAVKNGLYIFTACLAQMILCIVVFALYAAIAVGVLMLLGVIHGFSGSIDHFLPSLLGWKLIVIVLLFIGYMFLMLLLQTVFMLTVPVAAIERRHFFGAVTRGYALIKHDFWKTFFICFINICIMYVIMGTIMSVVVLVIMGVTLLGKATSLNTPVAMMFLQLYQSVLSNVANILITPFYGIIPMTVYVNQRIKYEGLDIILGLKE